MTDVKRDSQARVQNSRGGPLKMGDLNGGKFFGQKFFGLLLFPFFS